MVRVLDSGPNPPIPVPNSPDTFSCFDWDYYSARANVYRFNLYGAFGPFAGDAALAAKFDLKNYPWYLSRIESVDALVRFASHNGGGGLKVRIAVFNDNAGLPGTLVASQTFVLPTRVGGATWFAFTFPTPIVVHGPFYHISYGYDPTMAGPGDSLAARVGGNDGTGRTSYGEAGAWAPLASTFWGSPDDLALIPHVCEYYSSCYSGSPSLGNNTGYLQAMPDNTSGWTGGATFNGFGQRFVSPIAETITQVDVKHYAQPGYYTGASTNGLVIQFWNDNGSGGIDNTAPIATATVAGGAGLFPNTGIGGTGWNTVPVTITARPVMRGSWHVTVKMLSDLPADGQILGFYTDPVVNPGPSGMSVGMSAPFSPYWQRSYLVTTDWGFDAAYNIRAYRCKDEYAICGTAYAYKPAGSLGPYLVMADCAVGNYRKAVAQMVSASKYNRVEKIRFMLQTDGSQVTPPSPGNTVPDIEVSVFANAAGIPGPVVWSTIVPAASLVNYPGWNEVVIPGGVTVINQFWIGWQPLFTNTTDRVWLCRERSTAGAAGLVNGGMWVRVCESTNPDTTSFFLNTALGGADDNVMMEADYCSIPRACCRCSTPQDFSSAGADYGRTGHTNVRLTDAYCNLNFKWKYTDPLYNTATNRIGHSGPVVHDTIVVCAFGGRYRFLNLSDGSVIGEIAGTGAPYYLPTTDINCTPTIAMVNVGGTLKPIMYIGSGNSAGYRVFAAYDLSSWSGMPGAMVPAQLWSINQTNYGAMGYTFPASPMPQHIGATNYTNPIVLKIGGTDMVFFNTNDQYVWAADGATGVRIWGPIIINGLTYKGMATDGNYLYIANTFLGTTYPLGDITCWDAATGTNRWKLSTAVGGGLRGATMGEDFVNEGFVSGLAVYNGEVYAVSTSWAIDNPSGHPGGILYRINAYTGAVIGASLAPHMRQFADPVIMANVMVDENMLVVAGGSNWSVDGPQLYGYNRYTGAVVWESREANTEDSRHYYDGILTCEEDETDLGFVTNSKGFLTCFNTATGDDIFSRRFARNGAGGAIGMSKNGDLLVADARGGIVCMTKQDNRPRLEILNWAPQANTFGPLPSVPLTIPKVFTNTGCGVLTGTITFSATSNGATIVGAPAFRGSTIADQLTEHSGKMMLAAQPAEFLKLDVPVDQRPALNGAALATPPFLNIGTLPFSLNPGDTGDIVLDVHQSLVARGENVFYAWFNSNDEDYFLDSAGLTRVDPQVRGIIGGGCVLDTATLHFGTGADLQAVLNVPRYGRWGEYENATWYFEIGGNHADFYGGFMVYGVSRERIAMNTQDWWTGGGESRAYKSILADPNICTTNCKPALLSSQTFGLITVTGASYTPLTGNLVCRTYFDCVQVWAPLDSLGNWDWNAWNWNNTWLTAGTYSNDLTMGLITQSRSIGFTGYPAAFWYLGNVVVDFMKTYARDEQALPLMNWRIGEYIDYDLGGDTVLHYPDFSPYSTCVSVGTLTRTTGLYGTIKLPYGGGCNSEVYPTLRNAISMDGNRSMNNSDLPHRGNEYLDDVYNDFMARPTGDYSQGSMANAAGDQRSHDTWLTHNFPDNQDTLQFAIAHFGHHTIANPRVPATMAAPLSTLLNKWVGMDRGDVNNDGAIDVADIVYLADYAFYGSATGAHPGPIPFVHLGDVNVDGSVNGADVLYLTDYYFHYGPCPMSKYISY